MSATIKLLNSIVKVLTITKLDSKILLVAKIFTKKLLKTPANGDVRVEYRVITGLLLVFLIMQLYYRVR